MYREAKCPVCGKLFAANINQIFCGRKCQAKHYRDTSTNSKNSEQNRTSKKKRKKKGKSITELAVEARKAGMTYGQYVAKIEGGMRG